MISAPGAHSRTGRTAHGKVCADNTHNTLCRSARAIALSCELPSGRAKIRKRPRVRRGGCHIRLFPGALIEIQIPIKIEVEVLRGARGYLNIKVRVLHPTATRGRVDLRSMESA